MQILHKAMEKTLSCNHNSRFSKLMILLEAFHRVLTVIQKAYSTALLLGLN